MGRSGLTVSNLMLYRQKRKKLNAESNCNETGKPKRNRLSVLRLSGETAKEGPSSPTFVYLQEGVQGRTVRRSAPAHICLGRNVEESPGLSSILLEDGGEAPVHESSEDFHSLDHSIVQFTVGANNPSEVLLPVLASSLEPVDILGSPTKAHPAEPSECTRSFCSRFNC